MPDTATAKIAVLNEQIHAARTLAWNASQMHRSPFKALAVMDELINQKRAIERAAR